MRYCDASVKVPSKLSPKTQFPRRDSRLLCSKTARIMQEMLPKGLIADF